MKNPSLRTRLSIWAAAVFGLIITIFGIGVSAHLYSKIVGSLRNQMDAESSTFFKIWDEHTHDLSWSDISQIQSDFRDAPVFHPFEVLDRNGNSLYRALGLGGMSLNEVSLKPGFYRHVFSGKKYEVGVFRSHGLVLKIVGDMEGVDAIGIDLMTSFLIAGPVMLLVGSIGSWWLLRRAFIPVDQIVAAAEQITAQRLHARLPVSPGDDEISRLTIVLNKMINRLEVSFNQANRFTVDASHELRTPLTIIRNELELQIRKHERQPTTQKAFVGLLEQTTRLNSITEKLLLLSRADAGHLPVKFARFNLSGMLHDLMEDADVLGTDFGIVIHGSIASGVSIEGDRELLHQLLLNLIDNAVKYNQPGGSIWIELLELKSNVEIHVANTGTGISADAAPHIFDRFYRGSENRGTVAGQGLGLSLCREIVLAHRGDIRLKTGSSDRTEFVLTLPRKTGKKIAVEAVLISG